VFRTNISILSDADLYEHTIIRLESIGQLMETRPILDADLAEATKKCLMELKAKLMPQTSSDYWYDNFVGRNGEVQPQDLNEIASLVEERRTQIQFLNAVLSRL